MVAEKTHHHSWNLQKNSLSGSASLCVSQCDFFPVLCFLVYLLLLKICLDDHFSWNNPISISISLQNITAQPHEFWWLIFAFVELKIKILWWLGSLNLILTLVLKRENFLCEWTRLNELSNACPSLMARSLFLYHHHCSQFLIPCKSIHPQWMLRLLSDPVKKLDYVVVVEKL